MSVARAAGGAVPEAASTMVELVERVVERLPGAALAAGGWKVVYRDPHSNDAAEVHTPAGHVLHIKRARGPDGAERCAASRLASRMLRERVGVAAPVHLDLEPPLAEPVIAYWRLYEPTLHGVIGGWPPGGGDLATLESLGRLIARIQDVRFDRHGPLATPSRTFAEYLEIDVGERLRPAVYGEWLDGTDAVEGLLDVARRFVRDRSHPAVLVHNDLHADNVLCRTRDGVAICVGVLDLEDAFVGPPEADPAKLEVLHGPLFGQSWRPAWHDAVVRGYGRPLEPFRLAVLRIYHLLNLGYYAAHVGLDDRARSVARAAERELDALGEDLPHREVVRPLA